MPFSFLVLLAFNPAVEESEGIRLSLSAENVAGEGALDCVVENRGSVAVAGVVTLRATPPWQILPRDVVRVQVAPGEDARSRLKLQAKGVVFPEFYAVHATGEFQREGRTLSLAPILVFKPSVPWPKPPARERARLIGTAPEGGGSLVGLGIAEVRQILFSGAPEREMPQGWTGSDEETGTYFEDAIAIRRGGDERRAIALHPPWRAGPGRIVIDYPIALPASSLQLRFAMAIRDTTRPEPPSDGITFEVSIIESGRGERRLFSSHVQSTTWVAGGASLAGYEGSEVVLRIAGDPGPRRDTTCDQGFVADLLLVPVTKREEELAPAPAEESMALSGPSGAALRVVPSRAGIWDSVFAIAAGDARLSFRGFSSRFLLPDGRAVNPAWFQREASWERTGTALSTIHRLTVGDGAVRATIEPIDGGFTVSFKAEGGELLATGPGPFSAEASRVYAGAGNVIVRPRAFRLLADGHQLSTRFAGFDFPGLSLVMATDTLPDHLDVDPAAKLYRLAAGEDPTFTFVASRVSAFEAARIYRGTVRERPAGGVGALKGRMVFDLWGGRYRESAERIAQAAAYGITGAVVVWHNWQRWGYDYRLPEIFPPNPAYGTREDFRFLADTCRRHGIIFAPHDNYIDVYPDFPRFTFDLVAMTQAARPVRAWYNEGRDAQSYRFRPDRFTPFMEENVRLLAEEISPTGYFIDVFASIGPFDFYDERGKRHRRRETIRAWADCFSWIRTTLGGAPQISESGHDALIGALDGAQANHLRVDATSSDWSTWRIACEDAERIPWFDAVWRDRFVLHGAGYPNRFAGGLPLEEHGWESDDYLSVEALTGRPSMVSQPFGRAVARKYFLWHDFADAIGLVPIKDVEFVGGDIHVQRVTYENGATVCVNRSAQDVSLDGATLPRYGFLARHAGREAAIARRGGKVVEWSRGPGFVYANARGQDERGRIALKPMLARCAVEDGELAIALSWKGRLPGRLRDPHAFVHFLPEAEDRIAFQADHALPAGVPGGESFTSQARARPGEDAVAQGATRAFRVVAGLLARASGRRLPLLGRDIGSQRILLGRITLRRGERLELVEFVPAEPTEPEPGGSAEPVDFGFLSTSGAFMLRLGEEEHTLVPLPEGEAFAAVLPRALIREEIASVKALGVAGTAVEGVRFEKSAGAIALEVPAGVFTATLVPAHRR